MAVPRANTSKARTRRRQHLNMKLEANTLIACPSCGNQIVPHHVCPKCGFYRGKQRIIPK
jgi:large subunit ribosomal protein L32